MNRSNQVLYQQIILLTIRIVKSINISFCFSIFIEITPFRQCGPKKTWPNGDVQNGCSSNALGSTRTCYCDTDLCNFAKNFVPNWFLIGFGLIIELYYLLI